MSNMHFQKLKRFMLVYIKNSVSLPKKTSVRQLSVTKELCFFPIFYRILVLIGTVKILYMYIFIFVLK